MVALPSSRDGDVPGMPAAIGPYRLIEVLGEGGMGTVYLAEQEQPMRRRVALKVVKLGMDSRAVLARFDVERQALAVMEHDNIARVLDAGIAADGRPYFAMEYVSGVPLVEFCDQERLGLRERLELFCRVCHGVQHAHQKGVIHRDLKPANILVAHLEHRAVPKIIDFGLARAIDRGAVAASLFTEMGQILGTPEYMSPEQAGSGDSAVDSRTDVYSLGVVLYELLVGERPFPVERGQRVDLLEVRRQVLEVDPPRPSSRIAAKVADAAPPAGGDARGPRRRRAWLRALRGDLDWIVMRALEKDPARRYQTALALADDLGRNLRSEPIDARPPTIGYRLQKFVHKHRGPVVAAALVLAAVLVGAVVAVVLLIDNARARGEAEAARREALEQLARAQMAAIDQATWWTAQASDAARAPTLAEVASQRVDDRPVLAGLPSPLRDPWGGSYAVEAIGAGGDWTVRSPGPDGRSGTADDLAVHDRLFTVGQERRLAGLFERRAEHLLDLAQEWLVVGRSRFDPAELDPAAAADPWGRALELVAATDQLLVRSAGADGVPGSADDLVATRDLMPPTIAPADVRAQIGRSRRIYSVVRLERAPAAQMVAALQALVTEPGGLLQGLTMGAIGDGAVGLLGPPEKVAFALEQLRQLDASAPR